MKLTIATCQFPVSSDIARNVKYVRRQLRDAADNGADIVHFSEVCLSGYAGVEHASLARFDWDHLDEAHHQVLAEARRLKRWVILGTTHRLSRGHKPHNSLYIINASGRIVDRYDKMFCTGDAAGRSGDLRHYSPGGHMPVFKVRGVRCGTQICHDFRYQELYRQYRRRRVQLVFHSYHNGHRSRQQHRLARRSVGPRQMRLNRSDNIWGIIVEPTMQAYAANNHMWISANNTSAPVSNWPSFVVRPDGVITGRLRRHAAGVLLTRIDTNTSYSDASRNWRDRAMKGIYHSGRIVKDKRSDDRRSL